ncbi:MAG TPA: twin-arginine translocase subunit TatC [Humidesulfovibrio sp.]|uniref:twin-arginine translocase subunit TatC n=1 Tax=Humidesulfovibrio sp. TaxID=2910988 RepID=UPI002CCA13C8|nr:twin-arginine translocase subunit TatC [Humidesulfovibrio sp.]HWR05018.1 twin-arginine translocase subunit TatC [Humidesulfovibrio sp.]
MPGTGELLLIALVAIIVVDPKKLPDLMKSLGKAIGEFKQMSGEFKRTIERETEMADFEKRKAEAHEKLYGPGSDSQAAAAETPAGTPAEAPAQAEGAEQKPAEASAPVEHELQPEEYPQQPPVERAEPAAEAPAEATAEAPAEVPAEAPVEAPVESVQPPVEVPAEQVAAPAEAPAESVEASLPAEIPAAAPPAEVHQAAPPAEVEPAAVPAEAGDGGAGDVPPPPAGDDAVGEGVSGRMSLFGHLADLRKRLTRCAIAMLVGFLGCYAFAGKLLKVLMQPMLDALKQSHFIYTLPTEAFFTEMKVAFVAGIFACSPYIFYQIWQFVAPGLYSHERRWIIPIAFFSALCFTCGALFGYFVVFPFGFEFFASYTSDILVFTPKLDEYLDFVLKLLFAFGVVFELPLFLFFLAKLGIVTHVGLRAKRKYAILGSFIIAAALTPPDAVSQTMMAVPLCILYEVGIWLAYFFGKKPKPAPAEETPAEAA